MYVIKKKNVIVIITVPTPLPKKKKTIKSQPRVEMISVLDAVTSYARPIKCKCESEKYRYY